MSTVVNRAGDMHPNRALRIHIQDDGDIILIIHQDGMVIGNIDTGDVKDRSASIEFCVSGGRSRHTHEALCALFKAMEKDNMERPF